MARKPRWRVRINGQDLPRENMEAHKVPHIMEMYEEGENLAIFTDYPRASKFAHACQLNFRGDKVTVQRI